MCAGNGGQFVVLKASSVVSGAGDGGDVAMAHGERQARLSRYASANT